MFFTEFPRALLTFFICLMQMVTGALAIGFVPALVLLGYHKRYKMLPLWIILWLVCVAATVYGLPLALRTWRDHLPGEKFKQTAMYLGYFVGVLGAFFVFPEPMRQARLRLRRPQRDKNVWQDEDGREYKRKSRRKKRRTNNYDV